MILSGLAVGCECGARSHVRPDDAGSDPCVGAEVRSGCPCDALEAETCYTGASGTVGIGSCVPGIAECVDGVWGACEGDVLPAAEACNSLDDDCDGEVDDGVSGECGCVPCGRACWGVGDECSPWGDGLDVATDAEGGLALAEDDVPTADLWLPSSGEGVLYRVDSALREIEAAFFTGPSHDADSPGHVVVDGRGDAIVTNPATSATASITKIAGDPTTCSDRDGDGLVETSTGWDDRLAFDRHAEWEDECISWHAAVGTSDSSRLEGLALSDRIGLDGAGETVGWAVLHTDREVWEFDSENGDMTGRVAPTPDFSPLDAVIDADGFVWLASTAGGFGGNWIGRFDSAAPDASFEILDPLPDVSRGEVAVDAGTAWGALLRLYRWNGKSLEDIGVDLPADFVESLVSDERGSLWAATDTIVHRISPGELEVHSVAVAGGWATSLAVDPNGGVWSLSLGAQQAQVIDPEDETVAIALDDCGGAGCLVSSTVQGDPAGLSYRALFADRGEWRGRIQACEGKEHPEWLRLVIDASVPDGSVVEIAARGAESLDLLASAAWTPLGSLPDGESEIGLDPGDLGPSCSARALELRTELRGPRDLAPFIRRLEVAWECVDCFDGP